MSTLSYAVADSATMLRRQLRHMLRYASMTLMLIGMPIVFLLLFVYVFGGTLGAGLGRHGHDRGHRRPVPHDGHLPSLGADRPRPRQHGPDHAQPGRGRRRGHAHRVPAQRQSHRVGGRGRRPGRDHLGDHLAVGRVRARDQDRRGGQQPADAAGVPAVPRQRVRPHRLDADGAALVRRVPAVLSGHRDRAGAAAGTAIGNSGVSSVAWCIAIALAGYLWAKKLYNRDPVR